MSKPFPVLTGDPRVDRAFVALARLAAEVVKGEQAAARAKGEPGRDGGVNVK